MNINILRLAVGYINLTINREPETQNRRLEPMGIAKHDKTCGFTGTCPGLASQDIASQVFVRFWNRNKLFLRSAALPLAGYPYPLLTLPTSLKADRRKASRMKANPQAAAAESWTAGRTAHVKTQCQITHSPDPHPNLNSMDYSNSTTYTTQIVGGCSDMKTEGNPNNNNTGWDCRPRSGPDLWLEYNWQLAVLQGGWDHPPTQRNA